MVGIRVEIREDELHRAAVKQGLARFDALWNSIEHMLDATSDIFDTAWNGEEFGALYRDFGIEPTDLAKATLMNDDGQTVRLIFLCIEYPNNGIGMNTSVLVLRTRIGFMGCEQSIELDVVDNIRALFGEHYHNPLTAQQIDFIAKPNDAGNIALRLAQWTGACFAAHRADESQ